MNRNTISILDIGSRINRVGRLLRPLRPQGRELVAKLVQIPRKRQTVVSVFDRKTEASFRDCYFSTNAKQILAVYFEEWVMDLDGQTWRLQNVSLQLSWFDSPHSEQQEIVALHCEPREAGNSFQSRLKRGPHIHVTADGNRLSHAHFPLNLCHLNDVMQSFESLEQAIERAIEVLQSEVIESV